MRLEFDRQSAAAALKRASAIKYSTIPICTHVKLLAEDGKLTVTANDLEMAYTEVIPADVGEPGVCTASSALLNHAVWASAGDRATLRYSSEALALVCGGSKFRFATLPAEDFPVFAPPETQSHSFTIDGEELAAALSLVDFCISRDHHRPYLCGVYFETHNKHLRLVATDGASAAIKRTDTKYSGPGVIVPEKAIGYLKGLTGEVTVTTDGRQLLAQCGAVTIQTKLLDHTFPDVDRVIPEAKGEPTAVDVKAMTAALNRLSPLGGDDGVIGITARGSELVLSHSSQSAAFVGSIHATVGSEASVSFKGKRLARAIAAAGETALLHLGEATHAVRIESATDDTWVAVVMPWRDAVTIEDIAA